MSNKSVFLILIGLKYPPEHCDREIRAVRAALGGNAKPVANGKHMVGFVTTGHGTPRDLVQRLAKVLDVEAFENYWVTIPARPVAAKFGGVDTFPSRVGFAYASLQATPTKHLSKTQVFVEQNLSIGASRKMGVERGGSR